MRSLFLAWLTLTCLLVQSPIASAKKHTFDELIAIHRYDLKRSHVTDSGSGSGSGSDSDSDSGSGSDSDSDSDSGSGSGSDSDSDSDSGSGSGSCA